MIRFSLMVIAMLMSPALFAQDHYDISQNRSLYGKTIFIDQSITGMIGKISKSGNPETIDSNSQDWRGYGIRNGIGLELFRFTQLSLSHTLLNLRSKATSLEHLNGSEIAASISLSFSSPLGNIFFGTSLLGASLAYQNYDKSSSFLGSGYKHYMGLNYFLSSTISIFGKLEKNLTRYTRNTGDSGIDSLDVKFDGFGIGVMIWL